jgi:hypothetical protein
MSSASACDSAWYSPRVDPLVTFDTRYVVMVIVSVVVEEIDGAATALEASSSASAKAPWLTSLFDVRCVAMYILFASIMPSHVAEEPQQTRQQMSGRT